MVMKVLEESEAQEADRKEWDRVTILNKMISKGLTKRVKFELRLKRRDEGQIVHTPGERALVKSLLSYFCQDQCLLLILTREEVVSTC